MNINMEKRPDCFRGDLGLVLGSFAKFTDESEDDIETVLTEAAAEFDRVTNGALVEDVTYKSAYGVRYNVWPGPGWQSTCNEILLFYVLYEPEKRSRKLEALTLPKASSKRYNRTLLVNLGPIDADYNEDEGIDDKLENIRWAIRRGCLATCRPTIKKVFVDPCGYPKVVGESALYGTFERNEMIRKIPLVFNTSLMLPPVDVILHDINDSDETIQEFEEGRTIGRCTNFARMLHGPVFFMTMEVFVQHAKETLAERDDVEIFLREESWIVEMEMESFIEVAHMDQQKDHRGCLYETSYEAPKLLEIHYKGTSESSQPLVLIGKAIFYDKYIFTQGSLQGLKPYCLNDVSAGACIAATILASSRLKIPLNIIGVIPLCSHMPHSIQDYTMNTKVPNTYEERLILKDMLRYSHEFDPSLILTLATRTGYLQDSFEYTTSALYADEDLADMFLKVCIQSGERFVHLPFLCKDDESMFDDIVEEQDYCSITSSFLKEHALEKNWIHLDLNNRALFHIEKETEPYKLFEVTGAPTRTLIEFCQMYVKNEMC